MNIIVFYQASSFTKNINATLVSIEYLILPVITHKYKTMFIQDRDFDIPVLIFAYV